MALITSRTGLNQGSELSVAAAIWATGTGADIRIHTSAANNLPALAATEYFEVRDHSISVNNGLYQVVTVNTSTDDYEVNKITAGTPTVQAAETITTLGATGTSTEKSIHLDAATLKCYGIEQGNMTSDGLGANGDALYSFFMQEWKEDNYLIANAPFPMNAIDKDAGKYIMGEDSSGNSNGWTFEDLLAETPAIRTRQLWRNMGWNEVDSAGVTKARYFCGITLGTFEDNTNDNSYYQFGADTTVDDTVNLTFNGPANEAIKFYEEQTQTSLAITTTTITRVGGSFITEGYKVGGQVTIRAANNSLNDGTFVLTAVSATVLTTTGLTADATDTSAWLSVDNDNAFKIGNRVRDGDTNGKTFGQSNLAGAGKTELGNFAFAFPLANATDLKITETDANIDALAIYTGMSLTLFASGQSKSGLVGGPYNFSMVIDGNNGTNVQVFEWLQRQLRKNSDIDAGAGVNFGRALDLMARFNGDTAEFGSPDGGVNFPTNPETGVAGGLFVDNLNAASDNATKFWDDTGALRSKPESIAITLDGNSTITGDAASEYDLYYDRTIQTVVADLVLTTTTDKITSAGSNLPNNAEIVVGAYVRMSGMTDSTMDGVYQITVITTPTSDWTVARYDNATILTSSSASVTVDQNCVDTPDAIIVHTNVNVATSADVSFTAAGNTITSAGSEFGVFSIGDRIEIEGSTSGLNDGLWEVLTASATTLTVSPERVSPGSITTQGTGPTVTITVLFSGDFTADVVANYAFDDNVQGGRTVSTTTYVQAKAIGQLSAQYIPSPVSTIASGTPVTIPLFAATERNVT